MLVIEVFRAERKDPKGVLTDGQVETERVGLEMAVKDSHRPGGGVPWAYYTFDIRDDANPCGRLRPTPIRIATPAILSTPATITSGFSSIRCSGTRSECRVAPVGDAFLPRGPASSQGRPDSWSFRSDGFLG